MTADAQPACLQVPDRRVDREGIPPDYGVQPEADPPVLLALVWKCAPGPAVRALLGHRRTAFTVE